MSFASSPLAVSSKTRVLRCALKGLHFKALGQYTWYNYARPSPGALTLNPPSILLYFFCLYCDYPSPASAGLGEDGEHSEEDDSGNDEPQKEDVSPTMGEEDDGGEKKRRRIGGGEDGRGLTLVYPHHYPASTSASGVAPSEQKSLGEGADLPRTASKAGTVSSSSSATATTTEGTVLRNFLSVPGTNLILRDWPCASRQKRKGKEKTNGCAYGDTKALERYVCLFIMDKG